MGGSYFFLLGFTRYAKHLTAENGEWIALNHVYYVIMLTLDNRGINESTVTWT
jgi:hypothetical protein